MHLKKLTAALGLLTGSLAAGNASAAIDNGSANLGLNGFGTVGEIFYSVIARDPNNSANNVSYARDTGLSVQSFVDAIASGAALSDVSYAPDANWATFSNTVAANPDFVVSWNLAGVNNVGYDPTFFNPINVGAFTTVSNDFGGGTLTAADGPQNASDLSVLGVDLNLFTTSVDNAEGTSDYAENLSGIFTAADGQAFHDGGVWNNGVPFGFANENLLGDASNFWFVGWNNDDPSLETTRVPAQLAGTWTLASDGTLSFSTGAAVVPVPAAAWLFGSAMVGLVGVARRRAS